MPILSDEEIRAAVRPFFQNGESDNDFSLSLPVYRSIQSALLQKLSAGVSVEPVAFITNPNGEDDYNSIPVYTAIQLAAARVQENERIAKHFDAKPGCEMFGGAIADEIRALIGANHG